MEFTIHSVMAGAIVGLIDVVLLIYVSEMLAASAASFVPNTDNNRISKFSLKVNYFLIC
jgi:hypothetical protein